VNKQSRDKQVSVWTTGHWSLVTGHWSLLFQMFQMCATRKVRILLKSVAYCQISAITQIATHQHSHQFHFIISQCEYSPAL